MEIPEFTCLCPMTGQPDFATLVLDYVPDRKCVELKSLKLYVWSYRDEGAFHEAVTNRILDDLVRATAPRFMRLEARFNVRGGIYTSCLRRAPQARLDRKRLNPLLERLQPYPFEKLRALLAGTAPNPALRPINLSIGEPKHPDAGAGEERPGRRPRRPRRLSRDRRPAGAAPGRSAGWLGRRYGIPAPDPETQVLPVNGTREALFAFAQTVLDSGRREVVCPNPFYQIYEGAALLAGATPVYGEPARLGGRAAPLRLLARQPERQGHRAARMAAAVRAVGPARLRHRLRRVLFRDLLRPAADGRAAGGASTESDRLRAAGGVLQPVQALQLPRHALGLRRRRRRAAEEIPALPHLPRLGDEPRRAARLDRRLERRGARAREPAPVCGEVPTPFCL